MDNTTTLEELKEELSEFRKERDWEKYHDPKNLAEALSIEASELMELFLWKDAQQIADQLQHDPEYKKEIERELADVIAYSLGMALTVGLDVSELFRNKMQENRDKYPAEKVAGRAIKYTELAQE